MVSLVARECLLLSFPRRWESSLYEFLWTPAFAGVTTKMAFREANKFL
jgi:hypothetical protein